MRRISGLINVFFCAVIAVIVTGCAATQEKMETAPEISINGQVVKELSDRTRRQMIKERIILAKNYEEKKQFKKTLSTMKELQLLDPDNKEIQESVKKLETGLESAVSMHLQSGKRYFEEGDVTRSKKEFLMVIFLDTDQQDALNYLRKLNSILYKGTEKEPARETPVISVETEEKYIVHTLKQGESLSMLAEKYYGDKMKYQIVADFNSIKDVNKLSAGQQIRVPVKEGFKGAKEDLPASSKETVLTKEQKPGKGQEQIVMPDKKKELDEKKDEEKLPKLDSKSLKEIFNKGETLYQKEKFTEALKEFQKVVQNDPENLLAKKYMENAKEIAACLKKGNEFYLAREYGLAYDEYSHILLLKPDCVIANEKVGSLITPVLTQAKYLLHDEQSPCNAIFLTKKILKRSPLNNAARELLEEATLLEKGLELDCSTNY